MRFAKLGLICLAAAAILFCAFFVIILVFRPADVICWRIFSVCMPLSGISLGLGILFWVIALFKGK